MTDADDDLSPADVDAKLDKVVCQRVEQRSHLQLADAEDADAAGDDVGEEPLALESRRDR